MKLGHCSEISRESLAYPYPGKSVKINSGFGLPAIRSSKKLMARVRPGVELVRASFVPTRELITLDLPTLDRPRKAISGRPAAGNCLASLAESKNLERIRTLQFPISNGKMQAAHRKKTDGDERGRIRQRSSQKVSGLNPNTRMAFHDLTPKT